jgi:hypothetical protein
LFLFDLLVLSAYSASFSLLSMFQWLMDNGIPFENSLLLQSLVE